MEVFALDVWLDEAIVHGVMRPGPLFVLAGVGLTTRTAWVEELVCCEVILQGLERELNRPVAIIINTAIFLLFHLAAPLGGSAIRWPLLAFAGLTYAAAFYVAGRNL
jgi:membrane protease YdiL (CAAX protease family)